MLYQQGTQRIEVVVRKESAGGIDNAVGAKEGSAESAGGSGKREGLIATLTGSTSIARQNRVIKTNSTHLVAMTRQILFQQINWYATGIAIKTGDQALQENTMRQIEVVKDISGFASSVAMGALYGSWGGPIGTVLGATMAAITTATSTGLKYSERRREFNFKRFKQDNAIEYRRARANINLTTGRLR